MQHSERTTMHTADARQKLTGKGEEQMMEGKRWYKAFKLAHQFNPIQYKVI